MKEMYKVWFTVIKEFEVYDINSNCMKTFPVGTKLEWQRIEDGDYIQIMSDNYIKTIKCGNFKIEKYFATEEQVKQITEPVKHIQVIQFNNLDKMNCELFKYDEKDIISITPVKITTNTGIGHAPEDTIIYCVTVRE